MKILLSIVLLMIFFTSCDSFLEYKDKDKIIPSELEHYDELVYGEILTKSSDATCKYMDYMSDDVGSFVPDNLSGTASDNRLRFFPYYSWSKEPQISEKGDETVDPAWENFYNRILMCNIVEHDLSAFEEDAEGVKLRLLGEVQFIRAVSYFYLVNLYGAPYKDKEQAKTAIGVPVNKESGIDNKLYTRESLQAVYDVMEKDLLSALDNLKKGQVKNTIFRPNKEAVRLFLSRVYLYSQRYDDVITVCNDYLKETSKTIIPITEMATYDEYNKPMINRNSPSICFTWMDKEAFSSDRSDARFYTSSGLRELYVNDVRYTAYFNTNWNYNTPIKYVTASKCYGFYYRTEEIYFNRAEAYLGKSDYSSAMEDLNQVYVQRAKSGKKLEANNVDDARELFRLEKRKEFCFENLRWFDIRRWGLRVEHEYQSFSNNKDVVTYVLEENSPNYVMPLPLDIQRKNGKIERLVRVDSKVLNK